MYLYFPESKGMTLEEVDVIFSGIRRVDLEVVIGEVIEIYADKDEGKKDSAIQEEGAR